MDFRLTQRHIVAINFVLVAAIAYFAAHAVNQLIAESMSASPAPITAPLAHVKSAIHPRGYYDVIVKRDVFNLVPMASHADPAISKADLHLKLLGTSTTGRGPWAIIENQAGDQLLYHLGDQIPDAGELVSIEKSQAIIQHGAQRFALAIPQDELPGGVVAPASHVRRFPFGPFGRPPTVRGFGPGRATGPMPDIDVDNEGPNRYGVKRTDVRVAMAHMNTLAQQLKATPNMDGNSQNGYTLTDIESGSLFDDLGLEDGDIVTRINGRPINNPAMAAGMLATLQMRRSIDVTVLRDGQTVDLHYDIH